MLIDFAATARCALRALNAIITTSFTFIDLYNLDKNLNVELNEVLFSSKNNPFFN